MTDTKESPANKLHEVYAGLQSRLEAGLASSRSGVTHPGATGAETEENWLELLRNHLPRRYMAETAFVMDAQGKLSEQIDIVIYDRQYTPELYNFSGQKVIPAEGVYAVLEVKQSLDKGNVEYAGGKIASVRCLERTSAPIVHAGGKYKPRPLTPIIGGILTTNSGWTPPLGEPFTTSLQERPAEERIDLGCVINACGFDASYPDASVELASSPQEHALAFFFLRLLNRLQKIGTVPALDYEAYLCGFEQISE